MTNPRRKPTGRPIRSKTPPSVAVAAASGSEEQLLLALRHTLATAIAEGPPARDLSSLSRRLMEVSRELAVVQARREQEMPARQPGGHLPDDAEPWDGL